MDTKTRIINFIKTNGSAKSSRLVELTGISRQTIANHLRNLVNQNILVKHGATNQATYYMAKAQILRSPNTTQLRMIKNIKGLEEHTVFEEVDQRLNLSKVLSENAHKIVFYAFTEMLNNAIDHSGSPKVAITTSVTRESLELEFEIKDSGIGIFENIRESFNLQNEFEALAHLLKGKQTTMPSKHSGEGIYFTSKIADRFIIRSHRIQATFENNDFSVKEEKFIKGTLVTFSIKKQTRKKLTDLFKEFSTGDDQFDISKIKVIAPDPKNVISRSQAKRLTTDLEKFKKIILDFKNVKEIGQGFADEVFRVFPLHNKGIVLDYINANPAVMFMIERAKK